MTSISLLIKPVGGLCNMRCRYCFYRDEEEKRQAQRKGVMDLQTLEAVFAKTLPHAAGRCVIAYQGGEPTLAGLEFFKAAIQLEKKYLSPVCQAEHAIQTNGLGMDRNWAAFFAENHVLVGISLDGPKALHDANRVDVQGRGTFKHVMKAIQLLKSCHAEFNILSVVTDQTCGCAGDVYGFFARNDFSWQQYIPCLDPLDAPAGGMPWSLTAARYGKFLKAQFNCWHRDLLAGEFRYNRYFDNLVGVLCGRLPEACDMRGVCSPQLVVESDGSVYPCDFYCLDEFKLGNFRTDTLEQIERCRAQLSFLEHSRKMDSGCRECRWLTLCRGGCRRHRTLSSAVDAALGRNRFCEAYQEFFEYAYPKLCEVAAKVRMRKK